MFQESGKLYCSFYRHSMKVCSHQYLFIHLFIYLFYSLVYRYTCSIYQLLFICPFIHLYIRPCNYPIIHTPIQLINLHCRMHLSIPTPCTYQFTNSAFICDFLRKLCKKLKKRLYGGVFRRVLRSIQNFFQQQFAKEAKT